MRRFLSVCSGIEAASVAFQPLGWEAVAFAEIEPFPCQVLAHHYPQVPNLGDLTRFRDWPSHLLEQADILCGGTPCQAFSVAGLRGSLDDERGNLTLTFVHLYDHLDTLRKLAGRPPAVCIWENVPGIFSDKQNAFGCFLAGLVGEAVPLQPAGGRWTHAGAVCGPQRTAAWRVLDAQYHGLAQRRQRVVVVASADPAFDPAAVLFEWDGLRRDTPPGREPGQSTATALSARAKGGGGLGTDAECDGAGRGTPLVPVAYRTSGNCGAWETGDKTYALTTSTNPFDHVLAFDTTQITSAANRSAPKSGDPCHPLAAGAHAPAIAFAIQERACCENPMAGPDGGGVRDDDCAYTLEALQVPQAIAFQPRIARNGRGDTGDIINALNALNAQSGQTGKGDAAPCVAVMESKYISFQPGNISRGVGAEPSESIFPTLKANGGDQSPHVAYTLHGTREGTREVATPTDLAGTIREGTGSAIQNSSNTLALAFQERGRKDGRSVESQEELAYSLNAQSGQTGKGDSAPCVAFSFHENQRAEVTLNETAGTLKNGGGKPGQGYPAVLQNWAVRRLTCEECELLQGFPIGYTLLPGKGKRKGEDLQQTTDYLIALGFTPAAAAVLAHCPDGPRYKSLGNSWAVPVFTWVGTRVERMLNHESLSQ